MPQSLANVLIHLIFSTKNRVPLIHPAIEDELFRYLATACRSCGCPASPGRTGMGRFPSASRSCRRSRRISADSENTTGERRFRRSIAGFWRSTGFGTTNVMCGIRRAG